MDFLVSLISSSIRLAVPILLPALGEIYSERAGVLNLGLEGVMLVGALFGFAGGFFFESIWMGILATWWPKRRATTLTSTTCFCR